MRHVLPLAAGIAALATVASVFAPAARADSKTGAFTVPRGTVIPVVLTKEIRVGGVGDSQIKKVTTLEVYQDVIVNGHLIAQRGDTVDGNMSTQRNVTTRAFSTNISQELALDVDDVVNFCGDTLHMKFERTLAGGARVGIASLGAHAHDAVFDKGSVLKATTDRVQRNVCSQPTRARSKALPADIFVSDEELAATATPAPK